jgi:hypothetical protein
MTRVDKTIPSKSSVQDNNGYVQLKPPLASCIALTSLPPTQLNPSASITPVAHKDSPNFGILMSQIKDFTDKMRHICVSTYPDPQHFLHLHITRFASHSNLVTAAVALHQGGLSIYNIAHCLRWQPQSVAFYLRETSTDIGDYTSQAILGARQNS